MMNFEKKHPVNILNIHQVILFKIANKSIATFSRNEFTYNIGEIVRKLEKLLDLSRKIRNIVHNNETMSRSN